MESIKVSYWGLRRLDRCRLCARRTARPASAVVGDPVVSDFVGGLVLNVHRHAESLRPEVILQFLKPYGLEFGQAICFICGGIPSGRSLVVASRGEPVVSSGRGEQLSAFAVFLLELSYSTASRRSASSRTSRAWSSAPAASSIRARSLSIASALLCVGVPAGISSSASSAAARRSCWYSTHVIAALQLGSTLRFGSRSQRPVAAHAAGDVDLAGRISSVRRMAAMSQRSELS